MADDFRLIAVARAVVDELNALMDASRPRFLNELQLRDSASSITANIREAYGRRRGPERNQFFRFARGSAEESDERLRDNFVAKRVESARYWRLHNRLIVIQKMLTSLMKG